MAELGDGETAGQDSAGDEMQDPQNPVTEEGKSDFALPITSETQITKQVTTQVIGSEETTMENTVDVPTENVLGKQVSGTNLAQPIEKSVHSLTSSKQNLKSDAALKAKSAQSVNTSKQNIVRSSDVVSKQPSQSKSSEQKLQPEIPLSEEKTVHKEKSAQSMSSSSKQKISSDLVLKKKSTQSVTTSYQKVVSPDAVSKRQSLLGESSTQELQPGTLTQSDSALKIKSVPSLAQKLASDAVLKEKSVHGVTTSNQKVLSMNELTKKQSVQSKGSKQELQRENPAKEGISVLKESGLSVISFKQKVESMPKIVSKQGVRSDHTLPNSGPASGLTVSKVDQPLRTSINGASDESVEDPVLAEISAKDVVAAIPGDNRESLLTQLRTLMNERSMLLLRNNMLQRRMAEYYRKRNLDHALKEVENIGGVDFEELYRQKLLAYEEMKAKEEEEISEIERVLRENKSVRDEHRECAEKAFAHLQETERAVGIGLIDTRYGKRIPDKVVERLLSLQASRAHDTSILRLRWLRARDTAARLEETLRELDTVAGGLRVADYHQLLLDSQTYMEKIEDREGELARYRVSCTGHGTAAAHAREKLRCLDERAIEALEEREEVERDYRDARDHLNKMKIKHDRLRSALLKEQRRAGLLGRRELLFDYDNTLDEIEILKGQFEELQKKFQKSESTETETIDEWINCF